MVPRRTAQRYAKSEMTRPQIARKLGVDYLLLGNVRWAPGETGSRHVRVTLELIKAQNERQLWATTYNRVIDDIFEVQSDIAGQVTEKLGVALSEHERSQLNARPTANHEAWTGFEQARRGILGLFDNVGPLGGYYFIQRVSPEIGCGIFAGFAHRDDSAPHVTLWQQASCAFATNEFSSNCCARLQ